MPADIHVIEMGDGWEVRRVGDSMPLGTYMTEGEARGHADDQAERDGSTVLEEERHIVVDDEAPSAEAEPAP